MKHRLIPFLFLLTLVAGPVVAQGQPAERQVSKQEYIDRYSEDAVKEMLRSGVPASITLGQGMLESAYGNSPLAKYANNHFGIKCHKEWDGPTFYQDDDASNECFRKYYTVMESYRDHSEFLRSRRWYEPLFELKTTDYKGWARGLKKAGYATDPRYAEKLIKVIEDNRLYEFDKANKMPKKSKVEALAEKEVMREPATVDLPTEVDLNASRVRLHENNIKYVVAREGDTYASLAKELDMMLWQFYRYNEIHKDETAPPAGMTVYLQPKRSKGKKEYHYVVSGESMWTISQKYGIRLKHLYKRNNMEPGTEPDRGQKVWLKGQKP